MSPWEIKKIFLNLRTLQTDTQTHTSHPLYPDNLFQQLSFRPWLPRDVAISFPSFLLFNKNTTKTHVKYKPLFPILVQQQCAATTKFWPFTIHSIKILKSPNKRLKSYNTRDTFIACPTPRTTPLSRYSTLNERSNNKRVLL